MNAVFEVEAASRRSGCEVDALQPWGSWGFTEPVLNTCSGVKGLRPEYESRVV